MLIYTNSAGQVLVLRWVRFSTKPCFGGDNLNFVEVPMVLDEEEGWVLAPGIEEKLTELQERATLAIDTFGLESATFASIRKDWDLFMFTYMAACVPSNPD